MDEDVNTIRVANLSRVEGEAALFIRTRPGEDADVQLKIFEPPRFFEALLRGRSALEAPDITARICGICPVAYQMSAVKAVEAALGLKIGHGIRQLRRLMYCGEWIESHALHAFMLHMPDFLGYSDAIAMAKDFRNRVEAGLVIKKAGNAIVSLLGGREVHPINVKVGGFYRLPRLTELLALKAQLQRALELVVDASHWVSGFSFPEAQQSYLFVALHHETEYPMGEGSIVASDGLKIGPDQFLDYFHEFQVPYSNALHCIYQNHGGPRTYLTGPLARFNLNQDQLRGEAKSLSIRFGLSHGVYNPYKTLLVRLIEITFALEEALKIIDEFDESSICSSSVELGPGIGSGATEAPRGLLFHRYQLDPSGTIIDAKIIPPTSQNQRAIEHDLRGLVKQYEQLPKSELQQKCEHAIRNHDPCISCSAHFLQLHFFDEGGASTL